ncbi:MAG: tRNA lysidine(34) synthetase TilS [Acidimicrobiales bacterium]
MAAVSGGADSLALLVLAVEAGCEVTAVHIDHGLRPGSGDEAEVVRDAAVRFGAAFVPERVEVAPGPNVEARAREARRSVLPAGAMTGHTADDQAETVLLNLIRGAGLDGVGAMRPGLTKPILALRRVETARLCADRGLTPVIDPTNVDPAFRRNRVRHEVLPLLTDVAERDVVPIIARTAELAAADVDLLDGLAAAIDPSDGAALAGAPLALARRAVRRWLAAAAPPHPPDAASVERVLAVARGETVATELAGGLRVARTAGRLRIERR